MPVTIRKVKGGCSVRTPRGVKAKRTSCRKAKAQKRLLDAIDHNPRFKPRRRSTR